MSTTGSSSRARLADVKSMSNASITHSSARSLHPPIALPLASLSSSSLSSSSLNGFHSSSSLTSRPTGHHRPYKSIGLACEVRLKEAIERSRVADRLLRGPSSGESNSDSAGSMAVDRSISRLAQTLLDTIHDARGAQITDGLHAQLMAVLDQLVWSDQNRVVELDANESLSASRMKGNNHPPASATLERITNYELNLLHAKNDANWRVNYGSLSEREAALSDRVALLERENSDLREDMLTMSRQSEAQNDHRRGLERIIQSLDGRLQIAQEEYAQLGAKLTSVQNFSSEQQEMIIQARHEILIARKEADASRASWSLTETTDALRAQLHDAGLHRMKVEEQVASTQKLYYGMMQSCHKAIQQKDALNQELASANARITELSLARDEMLRPYTPRPDWPGVYRAHLCELTPTFLLDTTKPTEEQIHTILNYLTKKNSEIASLTTSIEQTIDVQNGTKKELAKARRDLEIAIRSGMSNNVMGVPGRIGGGDGSVAHLSRVNMSTLYMKPKSTSRYFIGLGLGKEVPAFLRAQGKIRNRHLSKKDTEAVIRDVWARKMAHDRERGRLDLNLADWFHFYLKHKYGLPSLVSEFAYNVVDSCERYRWDADCEIFLKCLIGEIAEEAYYDQCILMQTLTHLFMQLEIIRSERKAANLTPGASVNTLPMDYISRVLRLLFPYKPDEAFEAVCASLNQVFLDAPKSQTDYGHLFRENRTMNETGFVEEIRDQHLYEIENFHIQLTEEIVLLPREVDENDTSTNTGEGKVRMYDIHNAWIRLDPQVTVEMMDRHIARALRYQPNPSGVYPPVDPTMLVAPNEFCKSLFSMSLIKYTCNYDPNACAKLATIPLPDLLSTPNAPAATSETDVKKPRNLARRATYVDPSDIAALGAMAANAGAGGGVGVGSGVVAAVGKDKPKSLVSSITAPKVVRLRARFGLESKVDDIPLLDRGPQFQDPTSMKMTEKEVETLMTEKASLEEARAIEKNRLKENAERSAQAIQGIGVIKRRDGTGQAEKQSNTEEKSSTILPSSRSSLDRNSILPLSTPAPPTTALDVSTSETDSGANKPSPHSSSSHPSPPSAIPSALPSNGPLKYRSSFFTAPDVHASDAIHQEPTTVAQPGAAFRRRYTNRRRSQDTGNPTSTLSRKGAHMSSTGSLLSSPSSGPGSMTSSRDPSRPASPEQTSPRVPMPPPTRDEPQQQQTSPKQKLIANAVANPSA